MKLDSLLCCITDICDNIASAILSQCLQKGIQLHLHVIVRFLKPFAPSRLSMQCSNGSQKQVLRKRSYDVHDAAE